MSRWLPLCVIAALCGACGGPPVSAAPGVVPRNAPRRPVRPVSAAEVPSPEAVRLRAAIRAVVEPQAVWWLAPTRAPSLGGASDSPLPPLVRSMAESRPAARGPDEPRLPPETVQRIVRQSAGRFRGCVRRGLRSDPRVQGRVVVRFTIGADGLVSRAEEELATLADRDARQCLLSGFFELRFPAPPSGSLRVRYTLTIAIGADRPPDELHQARRTAEPPPPGFEEALRAGHRVAPPDAPAPYVEPAPPPSPVRSCGDDDPMCGEL